MIKTGFDDIELLALSKSLNNIGKQFPGESGEFLRQQGTSLNRQTKKTGTAEGW